MTTLVFGANGAAGRALLSRLESDVVAVLRQPSDDVFFADRKTAVADVFDELVCEEVINHYHPSCVISFVGGKDADGKRADGIGNINIINACKKWVKDTRFILITSIGCGEQYEQMSEQFKQFLGEAVRAKTEAEAILKESGLRWTILRPSGLNNDESEAFELFDNYDKMPNHYLSRNALACAVKKVITNEFIGQTWSVN